MAKLLTNREMELFRLLIWSMHDEHGGTIEDIAADTVKQLSFEIDEDDIAECCETASGQRGD